MLLDDRDHALADLDWDRVGIDRQSGLQFALAGLDDFAAEECLRYQVLG